MNDDYKMYFQDDEGYIVGPVGGIQEAMIYCDDPVYHFEEDVNEINDIFRRLGIEVYNALEGFFKDTLEILQELIEKLQELFKTRQKWPIVWKIRMIIIVNLRIIKEPP